ncbi:hypothetical protein BGZ65_008422, partial [Modicella reniformis]
MKDASHNNSNLIRGGSVRSSRRPNHSHTPFLRQFSTFEIEVEYINSSQPPVHSNGKEVAHKNDNTSTRQQQQAQHTPKVGRVKNLDCVVEEDEEEEEEEEDRAQEDSGAG